MTVSAKKVCGAEWNKAPACPHNSKQTSRHTCIKTKVYNAEKQMMWHEDGITTCRCKCNADTTW